MNRRSAGQRIQRVFLWTMVVSFCLAAAAGILVLLGMSLDETGGQVLLTTMTVGLFSLAMLCCGAVFTRRSHVVGICGVAVSLLTLGWTIFMIWSERTLEWGSFQVLLSGITLTVALSFASLVLASTTLRDRLVQSLVWLFLASTGGSVLLTLLGIWEEAWWEGEFFARSYGIVLILAVLCGVLAPLLSSLRKRRNLGSRGGDADAPARESTAPTSVGTLDPDLAAALEHAAAEQGITVAQLVEPILREPR